MRRVVHILNVLGWVFGAIVVIYGGLRYLTEQSLPALLVAPAVVIAASERTWAVAGRRGMSIVAPPKTSYA